MRTLIVLVALMAPTVFGGPMPNVFGGLMPIKLSDKFFPALAKSVAAAKEQTRRTIPSGSCGVNHYDAFMRQFRPDFNVIRRTPYIVGGQEAQPNEWPWQVSLKRSGSHSCGGTIYNDKYIISAAHCFQGSSATASLWKVVVGEHSRNSDDGTESTLSVESITTHEKYNRLTYANDVAVLKLKNTITFNDYIQPICMPSASIGDLSGDVATVTGWGTTREGAILLPNELQEVEVPVITNEACQKNYEDTTIKDSMICAGYDEGGKDSCQGDSGGPMVHKDNGKWSLVGIVSWGYGCARSGYPGVYTRVSSFLDWIEEHTQ